MAISQVTDPWHNYDGCMHEACLDHSRQFSQVLKEKLTMISAGAIEINEMSLYLVRAYAQVCAHGCVNACILSLFIF